MFSLFQAQVSKIVDHKVASTDLAPESPLDSIMVSGDECAGEDSNVCVVADSGGGAGVCIVVPEKQRVQNHVYVVMHCLHRTIAQNQFSALIDLGRSWVKTVEHDFSDDFSSRARMVRHFSINAQLSSLNMCKARRAKRLQSHLCSLYLAMSPTQIWQWFVTISMSTRSCHNVR